MFNEILVGKVFKAPKDVFESGEFIAVGQDSSPDYNASRKPWFLQVREYVIGVATGPWVAVTLDEFKKWNPNVSLTRIQRQTCSVGHGASEPCCGEVPICRLRDELGGSEEGLPESLAQLLDSRNGDIV